MKAAAEIAVAHLGVPGDFRGVDGLLIVGVHKVFTFRMLRVTALEYLEFS